MVQPFFITGLPCSRTAWLANLFTTGPVFCHHDLMGRVDSMDEFELKLGPANGRTGDSDSGLLACYSQVATRFPAAPWVLVSRRFDHAWDSLCRFVSDGPWSEKLACTWELRQQMLVQWEAARSVMIKNPRLMEVPFESLERTDMIECIWKHCVPGVRFDRRRAQWLQGLNVRPHQGKTEARPRLSLINDLYPREAVAG